MNLQKFVFEKPLIVRRFGSVSVGANKREYAIWADWSF